MTHCSVLRLNKWPAFKRICPSQCRNPWFRAWAISFPQAIPTPICSNSHVLPRLLFTLIMWVQRTGYQPTVKGELECQYKKEWVTKSWGQKPAGLISSLTTLVKLLNPLECLFAHLESGACIHSLKSCTSEDFVCVTAILMPRKKPNLSLP